MLLPPTSATAVVPSLRVSAIAIEPPDRAIETGFRLVVICCGAGTACVKSADQSVRSLSTAYAVVPTSTASTTVVLKFAVATAPRVLRPQRVIDFPDEVRRNPFEPS